MSKNKIMFILEILILIILLIWIAITKVIPDFKESIGSSDKFINPSNYSNLIEIRLNNLKPNFAIIINNENIISGILFFDNESLCLYNQNIEGMNIKDGLNVIVKKLIENDYLKQTSQFEIIRYKENNYNDIKNVIINELNKYSITTPIIEKTSTLEEKTKSLGLSAQESDEYYLLQLDFYSKEIIDQKTETNINKVKEITEITAKEYANNVYIKIENYIMENKITNQTKESTSLPINLIPADENGIYYPTTDSWYYVENEKVYAYIKFDSNNKNYSYCYKGSIDIYQKGEC